VERLASADRTRSRADSAGVGGAVDPAHELLPGELVGRFRVRRLVGQGGMGRVYLARDTVLGRSVALKVVRAGGRDAERFITEARITAQLGHPHIVQLFDVGRHHDRPYLALEYLEGESLRERMGREHVSVDEGLRILRAIADALAYAHARGIWHCDLKPSNVMLPKDGRVRVVDFGLASEAAEGSEESRGGTADWMAPEQWRGEAVSARSDVWALGVLAFQLLVGEHPFGEADDREVRRRRVLDPGLTPAPIARDGVPDVVVALTVRSLERAPAARPTASEWLTVLDAALSGSVAGAAGESPFRGLGAFEERHTSFFFGREQEIDAFLERLRGDAVLPVVGPSGVGKSSFVHAGVVPRLRQRERWTVLALRPGSSPFVALAHGLGAVTGDGNAERERLVEELRAKPALLGDRLATLAAATEGHVLLVVDQLEELFTQGTSVRDQEAFLAALSSAADDPLEPVRVVYTIRDDYLGRISSVQSVFVLGPLGDINLRRVIMGPLERLGYGFDVPELVDEMVAEARESSVALPLIQFACRALWDARDAPRRLLLESAYRAQGGVAGALARHADAVLAGMSDEEQRVSRQVLTRLVVGTNARRTVERRELLSRLPGAAASVLDRLLSARLLALLRTPGGDDAGIEIAHESLLTSWGRLAQWLEESGEERRLLAELEEAASFWERRGQRAEETWSAEEIWGARRRVQALALRLPERVERFLAEGERRAQVQRRRARYRRLALGAVATGVTATAILLAGVFRRQRDAVEEQAAALRLAGGNLGRVDIALEAFDWVDGQPRAVPISELPGLELRLYAPARDDLNLPGEPLPEELVRAGLDRIEAPGGLLFLRIDGRGRAAEVCAASWLRILSFPGYADREVTPRINLSIPTCQASMAGTVEIPEGELIHGGPGVPPTAHPEYVQAEQRVWLGAYRIDRTEVSNAMFAPFVRHGGISGYLGPTYPSHDVLEHAAEPESPVTAIDAFEAEAYCRFMGKRLPTDYEWTKAARGGLVVDGRANPEPRRLYPWGTEPRPECVNQHGNGDPFPWLAPVTALECGASSYGVLNLAGNVAEWIARTGQTDTEPLRVVRGGALNSPPEREQVTTVFRNLREARSFDFGTGIRCVAEGDLERGSQWKAH
jgi:eukaryotic-like serine/threonine-protein kinase